MFLSKQLAKHILYFIHSYLYVYDCISIYIGTCAIILHIFSVHYIIMYSDNNKYNDNHKLSNIVFFIYPDDENYIKLN